MPGLEDSDFEPQDNAEAFDETHTSEAAEMKTFEEMDDVLDVTREAGDASEDEEKDDTGVEVIRGADAGKSGAGDASGSGASADDIDDDRDPHTEETLDEGLEETFPASDPVSISPGAD